MIINSHIIRFPDLFSRKTRFLSQARFVTCWYKTGEYETLSGGDVLSDGRVESGVESLEGSQNSCLWEAEQAVSNTEYVEESSQDGKRQDWYEIINESLVTQSDGRVQDDRRKKIVEEKVPEINKDIIADGWEY